MVENMVYHGPVWSQWVLFGPDWSHIVNISTIYDLMVPYGSISSGMVAQGPAWSHIVQISFFSQSVSLTQYVVLSVRPSACLPACLSACPPLPAVNAFPPEIPG